jgi:hypothetical protein
MKREVRISQKPYSELPFELLQMEAEPAGARKMSDPAGEVHMLASCPEVHVRLTNIFGLHCPSTCVYMCVCFNPPEETYLRFQLGILIGERIILKWAFEK